MRTILALLILVLVAGPCLAQVDAGGRPAQRTTTGDESAETRRGWHFYDDAQPAVPPAPRRPKQDARTAPERPELKRFKALQKELEELRIVAVMTPTEQNVRRYMELESKVVDNASLFADVAQHIAWTTPELDPTTKGRPVNATAIDVFEQTQMAKRSQAVAELGKDHVLFFFFRSDCPYCHAYAPILRAFQDKHQLMVVPISLDGGGLPDYPRARADNGISRTLKVSQVPAVFLAQPFSGKIVPIGFGVLSESQLVERISQAVKVPPVASATSSIPVR